jgi:hypothetical protein
MKSRRYRLIRCEKGALLKMIWDEDIIYREHEKMAKIINLKSLDGHYHLQDVRRMPYDDFWCFLMIATKIRKNEKLHRDVTKLKN